MCGTCGCGEPGGVRITEPAHADHEHGHEHGHGHGHEHGHEHPGGGFLAHAHRNGEHVPPDDGSGSANGTTRTRTVLLEERILAKNDELARDNRAWLAEHDMLAVNVMSSPGAGKTTLLEHTVRELGAHRPVVVIEGDQETQRDAWRIEVAGGRAVQINTGSGCHLDAEMFAEALYRVDPVRGSLVIVENVGNLVCPALFDLGEQLRVVLTSVTEGTDKPLKYPAMFRVADLVLLNKIDLLPHVDFDTAAFRAALGDLNPRCDVLTMSATCGDGLDVWHSWLHTRP